MAKRAQIDIVAKDKASGTLKKINKESKSIHSTWKQFAVGAAAGFGMAKLVGFAVEARKAFEQQRRAVAGMETALKSMGRYTALFSREMQNLAKALQTTTNFGDEMTLEGIKMLSTFGKITNELMPKTVRVMMDLAAFMGGGPAGVARAAQMLGKASMGLTGALRIAGITLSEATMKSKAFKDILKDIEDQVTGQAEAMVDPWTQLDNVIGDSKEVLGQFVAIAFDDWARDAIGLLTAMNDGFDKLKESIAETERVMIEAQIRILERAIATEQAVIDMGGEGPDLTIHMDNQELFEAEKKLVDLKRQRDALHGSKIKLEVELEGAALEGLYETPGQKILPPTGDTTGMTEEEKKKLAKKEAMMKDHYTRINQMIIRQLEIRAKIEKDVTEKIMAEGDVAMAKLMAKQLKDDGMVFANSAATKEYLLEKERLFQAEKLLIMFEAKEKFNQVMKDWAEEEVKIREETADADIETLRKRKAAMEEFARSHGDAVLGIRAGLLEWREEAGTTFEQYKQLAKSAADMTSDRLGDAIYDVIQGTQDWKDAMKEAARSILEDISKMIIKMLVLRAIQASMGYMGFTGTLFASTAHEGGVVGSTSFPQRRMPAGAFAGAPRLHAGFRTDEFPAILQKGETVIPKGAKLSTGDFNISTNVTLEGGGGGLAGSDSTDEERKRAGQQIAGVVNAAIDERLRGHMRPGGMLNRSPA